jgi:hypothetical protein
VVAGSNPVAPTTILNPAHLLVLPEIRAVPRWAVDFGCPYTTLVGVGHKALRAYLVPNASNAARSRFLWATRAS